MSFQEPVFPSNLAAADRSRIFFQNREREHTLKDGSIDKWQIEPAIVEIFSITICSALIVLGLSFLTVCLRLDNKRNKKIIEQKPLKKLPCYSCQFFNKNPYLKCAVQPSLALTKDADNCTDYQSK